MEAQSALNLIIPLASAVVVVLISSGANVWLKRLDVQQRQADHKQELSKVLLSKKLEAGEAFVAGVVALINQLDGLRVLVIAGLPGEEDDQYYNQLQKSFQDLQAFTTSLMTRERNAAYLYFDSSILEQETDSEIPHLIQLEKAIVGLVAEKRFIEGMLQDEEIGEQSRDNLLWSYKENEKNLSQAIEEYAGAILKHRAYLVQLCGALRQQLAKYDLPSIT